MSRENVGLLIAAGAAVGIYLFYRHAGRALIGASGTGPARVNNPRIEAPRMPPNPRGTKELRLASHTYVVMTNPLSVAGQVRQTGIGLTKWEPVGSIGYGQILSGAVAPGQPVKVRVQVAGAFAV